MNLHVRLYSGLAALALAVVHPATALAEGTGFRYLSLSGLWGADFQDRSGNGNLTENGHMGTVTVESFAEWKYGDAFFFVDLAGGRFENTFTGEATGAYNQIYGEVIPRLSLSKIFGTRVGAGFLSDVLVIGEFDRGGSGFEANMGGLSVDLKVPGFVVFQVDAMARKDTFNDATYQATLVWKAPFDVGPVGFSFEGFADLYGTDDESATLMTQPQLVFDAGRLAGAQPGVLWLGTEWYLNRAYDVTAGKTKVFSVPQALAKATW
jgi:nucleoside-specific outer membrane channel protein Tsx